MARDHSLQAGGVSLRPRRQKGVLPHERADYGKAPPRTIRLRRRDSPPLHYSVSKLTKKALFLMGHEIASPHFEMPSQSHPLTHSLTHASHVSSKIPQVKEGEEGVGSKGAIFGGKKEFFELPSLSFTLTHFTFTSPFCAIPNVGFLTRLGSSCQ